MKLILCVEQVCVNLMCLIRENMNKILKWFDGSVMVLALVGAWTVWITERFYRHGYREGRLEYLMDDKERFGLREWLKEHPEDTEKFLGKSKSPDDHESTVKHPTFWTQADNWLFPL